MVYCYVKQNYLYFSVCQSTFNGHVFALEKNGIRSGKDQMQCCWTSGSHITNYYTYTSQCDQERDSLCDSVLYILSKVAPGQILGFGQGNDFASAAFDKLQTDLLLDHGT